MCPDPFLEDILNQQTEMPHLSAALAMPKMVIPAPGTGWVMCSNLDLWEWAMASHDRVLVPFSILDSRTSDRWNRVNMQVEGICYIK